VLRTSRRNEREQTTAEGDADRIITHLATSPLEETISLRISTENGTFILGGVVLHERLVDYADYD
jgi:hypothetical protein